MGLTREQKLSQIHNLLSQVISEESVKAPTTNSTKPLPNQPSFNHDEWYDSMGSGSYDMGYKDIGKGERTVFKFLSEIAYGNEKNIDAAKELIEPYFDRNISKLSPNIVTMEYQEKLQKYMVESVIKVAPNTWHLIDLGALYANGLVEMINNNKTPVHLRSGFKLKPFNITDEPEPIKHSISAEECFKQMICETVPDTTKVVEEGVCGVGTPWSDNKNPPSLKEAMEQLFIPTPVIDTPTVLSGALPVDMINTQTLKMDESDNKNNKEVWNVGDDIKKATEYIEKKIPTKKEVIDFVEETLPSKEEVIDIYKDAKAYISNMFKVK